VVFPVDNYFAPDTGMDTEMTVAAQCRSLLSGDEGQDLIEYSLLLAFIALSGAAIFIGMGEVTSGIWSIVNSRLAAANQSSGS
jgi:Flp pilus assembly pilin Flp